MSLHRQLILSLVHYRLVLIRLGSLLVRLLLIHFPLVRGGAALLAEEGPEERRVHVVNHFFLLSFHFKTLNFPWPKLQLTVEEGRRESQTSYCRLVATPAKMPETARYTALVAKNAKQAAADMSKVLQVELVAEQDKVETLTGETANSFGLFSKAFLRRHGIHLLGTTSTWFLLDIAFYSQNLFQKDIFSAIGWIPIAKSMNAIEEVYKIARAQTLIAMCSTVPGYWFTVLLIDRVGRFKIQLNGFFWMTVFMFALAIPYNHWTKPANRIGFVIMYALTFFFANFGPNSTTFVVPAEIFPARLRSTCHGISAAAGKAGAIVGAFGFLYAAQNQNKAKAEEGYPAGIGVKNSLIMLGVVNFLGMLFTFLVPESNGISLEEMSGENENENDQANPNRTVPV